MRMRKKPWAESEIAASTHVVEAADAPAGRWREIFGNDNSVRVEIGTGKGGFLVGIAESEPDINFVGIERQLSVFAAAAKKVRNTAGGLPNVRLINCNAEILKELFAENEVSRIYINFCDPWLKKRYEKRRLTHHDFLKLYSGILTIGGKMELRTDSIELFRFTVDELVGCSWKIEKAEKRNSFGTGAGIITEYEERFSALGKEIYEVEASVPPGRGDSFEILDCKRR